MSGPILFEITAADSHQQIILPVIRRLRARGIPVIVYSDCELLRTASDPATLAREGIPFVRMADAPLPASMPEWEAAALPFHKRIPQEVERVHPALVVVLNDRNFPSLDYVNTARGLHIPTLLLQESLRKDLFQRPPLVKLYGRWSRKLRLGIEEGLRHYGQGQCDAIATLGETSREYFRKVGVPARKITITGNPRFDQLAGADFSAEARRIRTELKYKPDDFVLTFLSSPIERMLIVSREEKTDALVRLLGWARTLRADPDWKKLRLVFKLHRGESVPLFREMLAQENATDFALVAEEPLYPLLRASQAALMFSTTAGLEAALLKVPVGMLGLSKPLDDWNFVSRGVAANVRSVEGLAAFLRRAREDPGFGERGANAAAYYIANFGCAAEAVTQLVARLAGYTDTSSIE
jgi:hypothetical protein